MGIKQSKIPLRMVAVVFATALSLSGCGQAKSNEEVSIETVSANQLEVQESVSDNSIPDDFADLTQEQIDNVLPIEEITQEKLYDMSQDEFRAFVYAYCPNFRSVYNVTGEMTDDLWESLRYVMSYQLFGTVTYTPAVNEVTDEDIAKAQIKTMMEQLESIGISYDSFDGIETDDLQMFAYSFKNATNEDLRKCLEEFCEEDYSDATDEELEELKEVMSAEFQLAYKIRTMLLDYPDINIEELGN